MWVLSLIPFWLHISLAIISSLGIFASLLLQSIPLISKYSSILTILCVLVLSFSLFSVGAKLNEESWERKVLELEVKLATAEAKSQEENIKIVEKIVTEIKYVETKTQDVQDYIRLNVKQYDDRFKPGGICEIPKEVIEALNRAATP